MEDLTGIGSPSICRTGLRDAVAGDQPIRFECVAAVRRLDLDRDAIVARRYTDHLVAKTQIDERLRQAAFEEIFFDIVLLQVHESGELRSGSGCRLKR